MYLSQTISTDSEGGTLFWAALQSRCVHIVDIPSASLDNNKAICPHTVYMTQAAASFRYEPVVRSESAGALQKNRTKIVEEAVWEERRIVHFNCSIEARG